MMPSTVDFLRSQQHTKEKCEAVESEYKTREHDLIVAQQTKAKQAKQG